MRHRRRPGARHIAVLPALITLGNGLCGFGAVTFAAKVHPEVQPTDAHFYLFVAGWLILAGMLFDALDGRVARIVKVTTDFGAQLDSLCDVMTFGLAPAFLLTKMGGAIPGKPLWVIAALYMACAALRLARFNVETRPDEEAHRSFKGLPSPAAGGAIAVIAIMQNALLDGPYCEPETGRAINDAILAVLPFAAIGLAILMVSPIRYPHLASRLLAGRRSFNHLVEVLLAIVFLVLVREMGLAALFWAYVVVGPVVMAIEGARRVRPADKPAVAEERA